MVLRYLSAVAFAFVVAGCSGQAPSELGPGEADEDVGTTDSALTAGGVSAWSMQSIPIDKNLKIQVLSSDGKECSLVTYSIDGSFIGKDATVSLPHERSILTSCAQAGVTGALVGVTLYHPSLAAAPRPYVFYGASSGIAAKPSSYDKYAAAGYQPSFGTTRALEIIGAKLPTLAPSDDPAARLRCTLEVATARGSSFARNRPRRSWHSITSAEVKCEASGVL